MSWFIVVWLNWQGVWYSYTFPNTNYNHALCEYYRPAVEQLYWDLSQDAIPPAQGVYSECDGPYEDM